MDDENPYTPGDFQFADYQSAQRMEPQRGLTGFEKFCAVIAFALAVILLLLGMIGIFTGCKAHFTLPPVLGVLPAFAGWGIIRSVMKAW